LKLFNHIY